MLLQNPERFRSERPLSERTLPERLLASCFPVSSLEAAEDVSVRLADANYALHDSDSDEDGNNGDLRGGSYARSLLPRVIGSLCRCLPWHWTANENHGAARRLGGVATRRSNQIARRLGGAAGKQAGGDEEEGTVRVAEGEVGGEGDEEAREEGAKEVRGEVEKEVREEGEEVREEGEEEQPPVYLRFENQTEARVDVLWLSHTGEEHCYFGLLPACCNTQATFEGNVWLVRDAATQKLLHRVKVALCSSVGRRQRYLIRPRPSQQHMLLGAAVDHAAAAAAAAAAGNAAACVKQVVVEDEAEGDVRVPSCYRQVVGTAVGVPVVAHGRVCMPALCAAADIVEHMLELTPPDVVTRLQDNWCKVAVIGREQVTTDILEHSHLRGTRTDDGRDWDCEVRWGGMRGGGGKGMRGPTCKEREREQVTRDILEHTCI
ncbi:unnamed protein product [Closterium sp. Naga37s-1]|nr:unnamed protein product [Closterium sp. Naga37s-1]